MLVTLLAGNACIFPVFFSCMLQIVREFVCVCFIDKQDDGINLVPPVAFTVVALFLLPLLGANS